ncbi:nitroreductase family protein [Clostridium sp. WILCCON 0269]|uniref:Nitroreductase family protein n=1 Tax=Candidatus Clostridium eludens TaxID=3381663 RepID=A0ABW8SNZ1_9CLOT
MNEVIQNILTRRSIRTYKEEQISDEQLNIILESGKYAPSGGNSQTWRFTVVQNKEKLEQLNSLVRKAFKDLEVNEKTYRSKKSGKKAAESDNYKFYYNAPTLIIVSNDREYSNCMADCAIALENILLATHSIGLGGCFINQLTWFCGDKDVRKALTDIGISENYIVCGAAAIGYNLGDIPKAAPRKEGTVDIIR